MNKTMRALCLLMVCILLVGCAKGGGVPPVPSPTSETAGRTETPLPGGTMSIAIPETPETLNPLEAKTREMVDFFSLIYDPLVRLDGARRPVTGLALRWETDETGRVWTIHLREDVAFHNGAAFTSADVVYTLDQLKQIYASSTRTSLYSGIFSTLSSYVAPDRHTVKLTCKQPSGTLLHLLNFPVVQRDSLTAQSAQTLAGGTGAYIPQSDRLNSKLVLNANPKWWRRTPYISRIEAKAFPDPETALTSVNLKLVDVVHSASLTANSYRQTDKVNAAELMTQQFECIIPNMAGNRVMSDLRMRQAIFAMLNKKTIITQAYLGHAVSVDVPIPPDSYLYDATHSQFSYSTAVSDQLLASMGYADHDADGFLDKDGVKLSMHIIVNENVLISARTDAAYLVAKQLKAIGIDSTVSVLSWSKYQTALKNGEFDLALAGFSMPTSGDLSFLLRSDAAKNYGGFQSAQMDTLLDAFSAARGEKAQTAAASAVQKCFSEQLPVLSLYFRSHTLVTSAEIRGIGDTDDMGVFASIENWYRYTQDDQHKVDVPSPPVE